MQACKNLKLGVPECVLLVFVFFFLKNLDWYRAIQCSGLNYKGLQALIHQYWVEQLYNFKPVSSSVPIVALCVMRE